MYKISHVYNILLVLTNVYKMKVFDALGNFSNSTLLFIYFVFVFFFANLANMSGIDIVVLCRQIIPSAANKTSCIQKRGFFHLFN